MRNPEVHRPSISHVVVAQRAELRRTLWPVSKRRQVSGSDGTVRSLTDQRKAQIIALGHDPLVRLP